MLLGPSADQARKADREERRFWSWSDDDHKIREVSGFSCGPENPKTWWVPELGYSMNEGYQLFKTRAAATAKLRAKLVKAITELQEDLAALDD